MIRNTLFSPSWWISTLLATLVTMCFIVLIKKVGGNIPVVGTIAAEV